MAFWRCWKFPLYCYTSAVTNNYSHSKYIIPMVTNGRFLWFTMLVLGSESCLKPQSERTYHLRTHNNGISQYISYTVYHGTDDSTNTSHIHLTMIGGGFWGGLAHFNVKINNLDMTAIWIFVYLWLPLLLHFLAFPYHPDQCLGHCPSLSTLLSPSRYEQCGWTRGMLKYSGKYHPVLHHND